MKKQALFTAGYEKRSVEEFFGLLRKNKVSVLLDVRYRAQSRRKGFSKSSLAKECQSLGIAYTHDRELGTPPEMMKAAQENGGYDPQLFAKYRKFLSTKRESLQKASELAASSRTCLLCYELDPMNCHRRVVAEFVAKKTGVSVTHI